MSAPLSMVVTDRKGEAHASPADFIVELVDFVNAWWRSRGAGGCTVTAAAYCADHTATLETRPGPAAITIADVRAAVAEAKEAA